MHLLLACLTAVSETEDTVAAMAAPRPMLPLRRGSGDAADFFEEQAKALKIPANRRAGGRKATDGSALPPVDAELGASRAISGCSPLQCHRESMGARRLK